MGAKVDTVGYGQNRGPVGKGKAVIGKDVTYKTRYSKPPRYEADFTNSGFLSIGASSRKLATS